MKIRDAEITTKADRISKLEALETELKSEKAELKTSLDEAEEQVKGLQEEVKTLTESNVELDTKLEDAKNESARYQHAEEVTK